LEVIFMSNIPEAVSAFYSHLKDKNFKATPQRTRIAEVVFDTHHHFTADELYAAVKKVEPLVGRVTVYRTLERLVEAGLVQVLATEKDCVFYEHTFGHAHHDHVVCAQCGKIEELLDSALEKALHKSIEGRGWQVMRHDLSIKGLCPACSKHQ
jgi:Fur family ferric uptake transcriptional regulator